MEIKEGHGFCEQSYTKVHCVWLNLSSRLYNDYDRFALIQTIWTLVSINCCSADRPVVSSQRVVLTLVLRLGSNARARVLFAGHSWRTLWCLNLFHGNTSAHTHARIVLPRDRWLFSVESPRTVNKPLQAIGVYLVQTIYIYIYII